MLHSLLIHSIKTVKTKSLSPSILYLLIYNIVMRVIRFTKTFVLSVNKLDVFELQSTLSFQLIVNAPLAVDSFFFLRYLTSFHIDSIP